MSITGFNNVSPSITGETNLICNNLAADSITLNGQDLQAELTALQNDGLGFSFVSGGSQSATLSLTAKNGYPFSFGGNETAVDGRGYSILSDCVLKKMVIALNSSVGTTVPVFQIFKNGIGLNPTYSFVANTSQLTVSNLSISLVDGDFINVKLIVANTLTIQGVCNFLFQYGNTVVGTNGTNGTDGQDVSFDIPVFNQIVPSSSGSITDVVTVANNIQNHALTFNIKRGRNSSVAIGSVNVVSVTPTVTNTITTDNDGDRINTLDFGLVNGSNGTSGTNGTNGSSSTVAIGTVTVTGSPTVTNAVTIDANGNNLNTLSFGLVTGAQGAQGNQGAQGEKGDKGNKGDNGDTNGTATAALAAAIAANAVGVAAGIAAASAQGTANTAVGLANTAQGTANSASSGVTNLQNQLNPVLDKTYFLDVSVTTPTGYTHFNATGMSEGIRFFPTYPYQPSLKINNNGNIDQTAGNNKFMNTVFKTSINVKNSNNEGKVLFDAEGTNVIQNNTAVTGIIETSNQISMINNNSIQKLLFDPNATNIIKNATEINKTLTMRDTTDNVKIVLDPDTTSVFTNPVTFNGNTTMSGNIVGTLVNSIVLKAINQELGSNANTQTNKIFGTSINIGTTANTTSMDLEANTMTLKSQDISIGRDTTNQFIRIGNSTYTDQTDIEGVIINLGTGAIFQTVNIGNAFAAVNIRTIAGNSIGFFNAIDQMNGIF